MVRHVCSSCGLGEQPDTGGGCAVWAADQGDAQILRTPLL
jgi:hypothetical protein